MVSPEGALTIACDAFDRLLAYDNCALSDDSGFICDDYKDAVTCALDALEQIRELCSNRQDSISGTTGKNNVGGHG